MDGNYGFGTVFSGFDLATPAEPFVDANGNGTWDAAVPAETFTDLNGNSSYDLGEPFDDTNLNGIWDAAIPAETFTDTNLNGTWDAAVPVEPVESTMLAGDYLVEPVIPNDSLGKPMYQVVKEEDINVFGGDQFVPQIPPPACAGPSHIVDVASTDGIHNLPDVVLSAVSNPSFADTVADLPPGANASPFEGMPKPLFLDSRRTSPANHNLMEFKRRWGAQVIDLPQFHSPAELPNASGHGNPGWRVRLVETIVSRSPVCAQQLIGSAIYQHMG